MAAKIFIVQLPGGRSSLGKLVSLTCLKSRFSWIQTIGVYKVHKNESFRLKFMNIATKPLKCHFKSIGFHHPLDGVTNPKYKLLHFIQLTKFFCKEKKAQEFDWDRCSPQALCLWLILFH
jgi:hypothetical protein